MVGKLLHVSFKTLVSTLICSNLMFCTLQVKGTDYDTPDGTCIRDYIDVTDLVDAHVKALEKAEPKKVGIYNVGTGKGRINRV